MAALTQSTVMETTTASQPSTTTSLPLICDASIDSTIIYITAGISYALLLFMFIFTKRKVKCCWFKRPGCLVALNMLDNYENRFGYTLAFGLTVTMCVSIVLDDYAPIIGPKMAATITNLPRTMKWLSVIFKILFSGVIAVIGAPFFICQTMKNRLIGSIIGFLFCFIWIVFEVSKVMYLANSCWGVNEKNLSLINLSMQFPKYACLILLTLKFVYLFIKTLINRKKSSTKISWMLFDDTNWKEEYMPPEVQSSLSKHAIKTKLQSKIYKYTPEFQYSIRMISSGFVSILVIYIIIVRIFILYKVLIGHDGVPGLIIAISNYIIIKGWLRSEQMNQYITCFKVSVYLALSLTIASFLLVLFNSFKCYRTHILKLRKGDWSFLPSSLRRKQFDAITPTSLMVASMKFAGYQVAYSLWGCFILFDIFFIVVFALSIEINNIIHKKFSVILTYLPYMWQTILVGIIVMIIQKLLARFVFIINKNVVAVNNRRVYHGAAFLFFYFNIFIGLVTSFMRIIYGMILGIIFFQRLQHSSLPRYYEKFDPGYMAYIGYILLEHFHANPVVQCFIRLLTDQCCNKFSRDEDVYFENSVMKLVEKGSIPAEKLRRCRNINRWHLYVMLSQNVSLQKYRYHRLKKATQLSVSGMLFNIHSSNFVIPINNVS
nr:stimulated by retinoic acid gene 6 protein-like isoform X2 [Hydra vulgaris]